MFRQTLGWGWVVEVEQNIERGEVSDERRVRKLHSSSKSGILKLIWNDEEDGPYNKGIRNRTGRRRVNKIRMNLQ